MDGADSALGARYRYRDPLDLPRIDAAALLGGTAEGVHVVPPGDTRRFTRVPPDFYDDPDHTGLFPPFEPLSILYPPAFTAALRDVTLVGFRTVLLRDGSFTHDLAHATEQERRDFIAHWVPSDELTPLMRVGDDAFTLTPEPLVEVPLAGPVVLLTSGEAGNFGSFLYRDLAKLVNLSLVPPDWRFLCYLGSPTFEAYLALAGVPPERLIRHEPRHRYRIERAIIPGLRNPFGLLDPETHGFFQDLRAQIAGESRRRLLYVSRLAVSDARPKGRVMQNEAALIERLRPLGFDIIEPQLLTAHQQIAAFAAADLVVGPSGAGMFNAVFCRPGTHLIDIESEPHWIFSHCCLFASSHLRYGIFAGDAQDHDWSRHHKPFRVDIEALLARITALTLPAPAKSMWRGPELWGENYRIVLQRFHQAFEPRTYLEIGVGDGETLALARCATIGIDPAFPASMISVGDKPFCGLYQMTSDHFFEQHDPARIFGRPIDLAFLDGMHWFEYLLRDFINVEKHCRANSIVFLHDCIPTDDHAARRDPLDRSGRALSAHPDFWTGDVWKFASLLMKHRPDLKLRCFDATPTGLIAVTRLDPRSTVLPSRYFDLVDEYRNQTLAARGENYLRSLDIVGTREFASHQALSGAFWL